MPAVYMRQAFLSMEENNQSWQDVINFAVEDANAVSAAKDSFLNKWLNPGQTQRIEFGQQASLQRMQNEWNSEGAKMNRLIDAGVNPLTAAQGVSQSGQSGSTGLVPSTPQSGSVPEAVESVGNIADKISSANERNKLLDVRKKNIVQDTFLKLTQAGYQSELAKNLALATSFMPAEKSLSLLNLGLQADKLSAEYGQIMQDIEESKARVRQIDQDIETAKAQKNYVEQLRLESIRKTEVLTYQGKEEKWRFERMQSLDIDPNNPLDVELFMQSCEGNKENLNKGLGVVRAVSYNDAIGEYIADTETAYNRAYEAGRAAYDFNWDAPPKTVSEFLWKSVGNLKDKLGRFVGQFSQKSDNKEQPYKVDENTLKNSYLDYKSQLALEYERLNMMRAELADKIAAGANQVETTELRQEIAKLNDELSKMPQDFKSFKKYVRKQ